MLSFAVHIDTTMRGRRAAPRPSHESELHAERGRVVAMFQRLEREHGVRPHLAHNMTVTPANIDPVADVVRMCRELDYRMCSFQPAAEVGDPRRWDSDGYGRLTDDQVWAQIERGGPAPASPGSGGRRPALQPRDLGPVGWRPLRAGRFAHRAGLRGLTCGVHPTTYVMHSFMDAEDVRPRGLCWNATRSPPTRGSGQRRSACRRAPTAWRIRTATRSCPRACSTGGLALEESGFTCPTHDTGTPPTGNRDRRARPRFHRRSRHGDRRMSRGGAGPTTQ